MVLICRDVVMARDEADEGDESRDDAADAVPKKLSLMKLVMAGDSFLLRMADRDGIASPW